MRVLSRHRRRCALKYRGTMSVYIQEHRLWSLCLRTAWSASELHRLCRRHIRSADCWIWPAPVACFTASATPIPSKSPGSPSVAARRRVRSVPSLRPLCLKPTNLPPNPTSISPARLSATYCISADRPTSLEEGEDSIIIHVSDLRRVSCFGSNRCASLVTPAVSLLVAGSRIKRSESLMPNILIEA
jgi:hypothetical protein